MTTINNLLNSLGITSTMEQIYNRVIRVALLDQRVYREIEEDTRLDREALLIVILASLAGGIAAFITGVFKGKFGLGLLGFFIMTVIGVVNYYLWAYITRFIAVNLFESDTDAGELLRILGYASAPRIAGLLGFVPCFGPVLSFIGGVWSLVAGFAGIREAVDLELGETIITILLGWLAIMIISGAINGYLGFGAAGLGPVLRDLGLY